QPLFQQYFMYLGTLIHGNLGTSYTLNTPVATLIAQRLPKTLILTIMSTILALVIAIPLGMWQSWRRGRAADYVTTTVALVLYSTPVFFLGILLIMLFSQDIPLLSSQAPQGDGIAVIFENPAAMVLPVVTGAAGTLAVFSRYMRSATVENLQEDYVRTARAVGTPSRAILLRHVLRNSLTPVVAMLGYYIPVIFGGSLVVEQLFNFPGMGLLFWNAAQSSDFPVLLGCVLVISIATVCGTFLADIAQLLIDPRVKGDMK
ncbi:MAG: ABC transporter permease, partial [Bifidobacterium sp.]